jgi:GTPase SAR1 family protein
MPPRKNSADTPKGVGKTSLLQRYTRNTFDPVTTLSTTGALFVTKKVYVNGLKVSDVVPSFPQLILIHEKGETSIMGYGGTGEV